MALARYDERGIFETGRSAELDSLRAMGYRDPSLGRLYEGHFNGAFLAMRFGTGEQRQRCRGDLAAGAFFGVWNTQSESEPLLARALGRGSYALRGAKTWASGADSVTRAMVTARRDDGEIMLCEVPLDRVRVAVDPSAWQPLGMKDSNSYRVVFDGVRLEPYDVIGEPGDYERAPWFSGGALRFAAVHAGIIERLCDETFAYLRASGRTTEPLAVARAGDMRMAARAARNWVDAGREAWERYDSEPTESAASAVMDAVDMVRLGVERCGLDVIEWATRSAGARGLLETGAIAPLVRDLMMYLRQPAPDAALARIGKGALEGASAASMPAIAVTTGSSG